MTKVIVYERNGKLCIVSPAEGRDVKDLLKTVVPNGCTGRIVDESELPEDRTFRNAWVDRGKCRPIEVDPDRAQNIRIEQLREMRNKQLELSDIQLKIAEERGDEARKQALIEYRNELRDMTDKLGNLKRLVDPNKIKAFVPDVLKRNMP